MKHLITVALFVLLPLVVTAELKEVSVALGPQLFREGDRITIEEVQATSSQFKIGDVVTVKGSYELASHPKANLSLYLTQTKSGGKKRVDPLQQVRVSPGSGEFEATITIRHEGYLHLTFYPVSGGSGFGGVYFGSPEQMNQIKHWSLDRYLSK
ncbi:MULTISPECIES: hypothetical protein [unclassified Lentimonas]|uniref:hypothetical protein n=1 Tax=unclassified Lentimonas TaxID=2630993 RepID=UPI001329F480|nr:MULTISPECIES: hypothetical protein [unclassified Lentimonas]CAA6693682.1 Unannotated [Lentimonas sp. CC10]CAA6696080.1 Unannotated [Lentimonas sp. CC19]CAA7071687.1 Unannotated [Lentimonas sp. CC11]